MKCSLTITKNAMKKLSVTIEQFFRCLLFQLEFEAIYKDVLHTRVSLCKWKNFEKLSGVLFFERKHVKSNEFSKLKWGINTNEFKQGIIHEIKSPKLDISMSSALKIS